MASSEIAVGGLGPALRPCLLHKDRLSQSQLVAARSTIQVHAMTTLKHLSAESVEDLADDSLNSYVALVSVANMRINIRTTRVH